ncbi:hypothetical protein GCM10010182_71290 [Actinomadura cremea]|nr:hypothetical protein GCM10010182_71290 [Actinomadura cremea]
MKCKSKSEKCERSAHPGHLDVRTRVQRPYRPGPARPPDLPDGDRRVHDLHDLAAHPRPFQTAAWLAAGSLLDLPGDPDIRREALPEPLLLLASNIALMVPVALAASMGRGYLPGVAATTGFLISGVAAATIGGIDWFP